MRRPSPALVLALIALMVALAGTGTAARQALLTGRDVKDNSLTGADIRNNSLRGADIRNGSLQYADLSRSTRNRLRAAAGATGARGAQGDRGPAGPSGSAAAFATVAADGTVDPARSSLAGGRVVKAQGAAGTGFYCVYDLPFSPKGAVASANIDPSRSSPPPNPPFRAGAMTYVMRAGDPNPISGCALDGLQIVVNTYSA